MDKKMTLNHTISFEDICRILQLPMEVYDSIKIYKDIPNNIINETIKETLKKRELWDQAIEEMQKQIGEDPFGFRILFELLNIACSVYEQYQEMGIKDSIFIETMKFCTRFIKEHKRVYGYYAFRWAWWFPRQLALQEFRIGELEYEFVSNNNEKKIYIHIPGDACMTPLAIQKSFQAYQIFLKKYFSDWLYLDWYCESWMLSPALKQLLPKESNLLYFQGLFDVEFVDYESMAVLDWVFPGEGLPLETLSENTTLQRNLKSFLLSGQKFGWAEGRLSAKI